MGNCYKKLSKLYYKKFCTLYNFDCPDIIKNINQNSKADAVYILSVILLKGRFFQCPKFMQVHDIFSIKFKENLYEKYGEKKY